MPLNTKVLCFLSLVFERSNIIGTEVKPETPRAKLQGDMEEI